MDRSLHNFIWQHQLTVAEDSRKRRAITPTGEHLTRWLSGKKRLKLSTLVQKIISILKNYSKFNNFV